MSVPLVVRMATGAGRQLAAQHSHSLENWYAHVPGMKTVAPATPADARGLLLAALADPDPVIVFEHQLIAPEADPSSIPGDADFRDELDIDSMDFQNVMIALHEAVGVEVAETDYPELFSIDGAVAFLAKRLRVISAPP